MPDLTSVVPAFDVESIEAGEDFRRAIEQEVVAADIVLAIMRQPMIEVGRAADGFAALCERAALYGRSEVIAW